MTKDLISVNDAFELVLKMANKCGVEELQLMDCLGRRTFESWIVDRDQPPFNRVMMDGIAIRFRDNQEEFVQWRLKGMQSAGSPLMHVGSDVEAMEVMTGAALPDGLDTVVPYEQIEIRDDLAIFVGTQIRKGQHILTRGSDAKMGDIALASNSRIGPPEIGIAASMGMTHPKVYIQPSVLVVATGDELVDMDQIPGAHQIRQSNVYALASAVYQTIGRMPKLAHVSDQEELIFEVLNSNMHQFDVIIMSGAVSMGKKDFVPKILETMGAEIHFHGIAQKPGKPMLFASLHDCTIFGLPGNPISSLACWARYVKPFLTGGRAQSIQLNESLFKQGKFVQFLPVKLDWQQTTLAGNPIRTNGSGDYLAMAGADGFIEITSEHTAQGQTVAYWSL